MTHPCSGCLRCLTCAGGTELRIFVGGVCRLRLFGTVLFWVESRHGPQRYSYTIRYIYIHNAYTRYTYVSQI